MWWYNNSECGAHQNVEMSVMSFTLVPRALAHSYSSSQYFIWMFSVCAKYVISKMVAHKMPEQSIFLLLLSYFLTSVILFRALARISHTFCMITERFSVILYHFRKHTDVLCTIGAHQHENFILPRYEHRFFITFPIVYLWWREEKKQPRL